MMYLLAVLCPPLAVLFTGKPFQALLNLILTCIFWLPARFTPALSWLTAAPKNGQDDNLEK